MAISKKNAATLKAVARQGAGTHSRAGLGVDIIEIERMERIMERTPRFIQRVFSEEERAYAGKKARPAVHFALFFAAREAVLKALGTGFAEGISWNDVEVTHDRLGRPEPLLSGRAAQVAEEQGIVEVELSLSYTHQVGVASAVAIKASDRPRKDEKIDPMEELTQRFKEMRSMLDDMDLRLKELGENAGTDTARPSESASSEQAGVARYAPTHAGAAAYDPAELAQSGDENVGADTIRPPASASSGQLSTFNFQLSTPSDA